MTRFRIIDQPADLAQLRESLQDPGSGGFCAFEGWVRDANEGRQVSGLWYEAYEALAIAEGERILAEACARFGVLHAAAVHRVGDLRIGDLAVWIGVSAPHRDEAFRACRYIIDEIKHRLPIWKKEHYLEGDTAWVACSHLSHAHSGDAASTQDCNWHGHDHTPLARTFVPNYSRQQRLQDVGAAGQQRLAQARVLVIGAGGLGVPVISYLAGAGVGVLGIVDDDVLDASNLHRQVMYDAKDVGQRKVDLAARRVTALNPTVEVVTYGSRLHAGNIVDVFNDYDLMVECTDNLESRYLASDAAVLSSTPLILASVYQYEGQLQVITPATGSPCLRCLWHETPNPGDARSCADAGVLGPVPGMLGALQAMEALKLLLDLPDPDPAGLQLFNLLDGSSQRLRVSSTDGCVRFGGCEAVARKAMDAARAQTGVERAFDHLEDAVAEGFLLVDLRDPDEIAAMPLSVDAIEVPASAIAAWVSPAQSASLLLICARGKRSRHAAKALRDRGLDAWSLAGGVGAIKMMSKARS